MTSLAPTAPVILAAPASRAPDTKRCARCGETYPLDHFPHHPGTRDRRGSWCRTCQSDYCRARYIQRRPVIQFRDAKRADHKCLIRNDPCAYCGNTGDNLTQPDLTAACRSCTGYLRFRSPLEHLLALQLERRRDIDETPIAAQIPPLLGGGSSTRAALPYPSPSQNGWKCPKCGEDRGEADFARDASKASGRKSYCRACDREKGKSYYALHRDRVLARVKEQKRRERITNPRSCERCGRAHPGQGKFCEVCRVVLRSRRPKKRRVQAKTVARGYGVRHQQLRKRYGRLVKAGVAFCARCGKPIAPGEPWDLGHVDGVRDQWWGPEHARCNRATAGRRRRERNRPTSRVW